MIARRGKRLIIFFLFLALVLKGLPFPEPLWAQETTTSQIKAFLRQGIARGFNLDEAGAIAEIRKAIEVDRQNPMGYAMLTMTHLFFYETSFTEKEKRDEEKSLQQAAQEAFSRGEKRVDANPKDGDAYFAMSVAHMAMGRWDLTRKNYYHSSQEIQTMLEQAFKVKELEPENYDIYFFLGVLDYHLAHLSGIARFLSTLFLQRGDKESGLKNLQLVAQKGDLFRDLARAELISVYVNFEKQPEGALSMARELNEKYPHNYNIAFALADIYSDISRPGDAFAMARDIENGIRSEKPPYRPEIWPRLEQLLGKIYLDAGDYSQAMPHFEKAIQDQATYNARVRAWALVRMGMIYDAGKDRKVAEEYYQKALDVEGAEGVAKIAAQQYLRTPYSSKLESARNKVGSSA
jgi:tetratricopeptide (TPR) repeat protein